MCFRIVAILLLMVSVPFTLWCAPHSVPSGKNAGSFTFIQSAATKGHTKAAYFLGTYYYHGVGTPVDKASAAFWFRKAAQAGDADAQFAYGLMLLSGDGIPLDKSAALDWLGKSARQNNAKARDVLSELLTYRGTVETELPKAFLPNAPGAGDKQSFNETLRLEGKGIVLDQGTFGLKFSLPPLSDPLAAPLKQPPGLNQMLERLQGGTFDIIIRPPQK